MSQRAVTWLATGLLVAAVTLTYWNSLSAPFTFDDFRAVPANPSIRQFSTALFPPDDGTTTTGRPLVNLSFAFNHALHGTRVQGYHLLNIALHASAALVLFGLVRRTLRSARLPGGLSAHATPVAFVVALLWALHPLQTESVTGISQRTEVLCGLLYLLTLYGLARAITSPRPRAWQTVSVLACLAGMGAKEVMVTAPVLALLYDRTFAAGGFAAAWRLRRGYYGALAGTWLLLAALLLAGGGTRGAAAGLGLGVSAWDYLLTQCQAIVLYLKLAVWPHPLVVDYGSGVVRSWTEVWWQGPVVLALLGATGWALWRRPALGFLGAWFFVMLAPSSSVVPLITQTIAEHRMYLPLAAVLATAVLAVHRGTGLRGVYGLLAVAVVAGGLTVARNRDYGSELALWSNTVKHRPENARAHTNLGIALAEAGQLDAAVLRFQESLRRQPASAAARLNLCSVLTRLGRPAEAVPHGEEAVQLDPHSAAAHINLARALAGVGRSDAAAAHYGKALQIEPGAADATEALAALHHGLGNQAAARGDFDGAIARYGQALAAAPDYLPARNNLANALLVSGRVDAAIAEYHEVLRRKPGDAKVEENLAHALELRATRR